MDASWLFRITHDRSLRKKSRFERNRGSKEDVATTMDFEFSTIWHVDQRVSRETLKATTSFPFYRDMNIFRLCGWRNGMIYFARRCERCTFVTSERVFDNLLPTWLTYVCIMYIRVSVNEKEWERERVRESKSESRRKIKRGWERDAWGRLVGPRLYCSKAFQKAVPILIVGIFSCLNRLENLWKYSGLTETSNYLIME